jgi:VIT1/CCC1 family predicted Fe2+/Mn2+ transporter
MERNEKRVIEEYKKLLNRLEGETKQKLELIIKDEIEHENFWMNQIKDETTRYLGFIILGLADAIIEITGVHAGFLGVTASTIIAGIAGLVVGVSASLAMASAAYLQAKQSEGSNPRISAIYTGIFYILAAAALAAPYFMTHDMLLAFSSSLIIAIMLIGFFNFYSSVIFERKFAKEFLTSTIIILVTAAAAFIVGEFLGNIFGIPQYFK